MSNEEIIKTLISLMKDICPNSTIDYSKVNINSKLKEDLNFDSLSLLLMAMAIETKFNIELNNLDYETINNVSNIVNYIKKEIK